MSRPTPPQAYYVDRGDGCYEPTVHAQGAWSEHEQHLAPATGILTHALDGHEPRDDLQLSRLTLDVLGVIHAEPSRVRTRTLRAGRTIELVEAVLSTRGRDVIRATAWRLLRGDTAEVEGIEAPPMPDRDSLEPSPVMRERWGGGYISSLETRPAPDNRPGRGRAWICAGVPLLDGVPVSDLARLLGLVDTANGVAVRQSPQEWMFPNTDLTIHLVREPVGRWLGLDTTCSFGPTGLGLTSSWLHDEEGPFGRAMQSLTVRPRV